MYRYKDSEAQPSEEAPHSQGLSSRPTPPSGSRKEDSRTGFPLNPRSLTSRAESGSPHPHIAPSSTGPGGAASSHCASAPPAGQRLHGNRTQTTYPGRLLPSRVTAGQSRGAGQGRSWEWARERGLLAGPQHLRLAREQSQLRGFSSFSSFPGGCGRGDGEGGAGGAGRGPTRRVDWGEARGAQEVPAQ